MAISSALGSAGAVPVGVVDAFAGATAPSGWLLCYGQAVSRTQYPVLFTTLSTTYGSGDGSTTFNIPDMRGRAVAGKDDMGGTAASRLTSTVLTASNTLGATGGAQTATIASGNLPVHTHTINHDHGAFTSGNDSPDHTHGTGNANSWILSNRTGSTVGTGGASAQLSAYLDATSGASARHQHNIDVPNFTGSSGDGGFANTALTNTQPTIVLNYIIKAQ
jgi:microcystin-dependent protein